MSAKLNHDLTLLARWIVRFAVRHGRNEVLDSEIERFAHPWVKNTPAEFDSAYFFMEIHPTDSSRDRYVLTAEGRALGRVLEESAAEAKLARAKRRRERAAREAERRSA